MRSSLRFDVFLSHNGRDKPVVRQLAAVLQERGFRVWLDEDQLVPGKPWQPLLEKGIKRSKAGIVLLGSDGLGPWEDEEMQVLLSQAVRMGKRVIPVILPGAQVKIRGPRASSSVPAFLQSRTWVDFAKGFTNEGLDLLAWGIQGKKLVSRSAANGEVNPFVIGIPIRNPKDFFGRDRIVKFCLIRLRGMQSVSIVGERRIGKSSLLLYITKQLSKELGSDYRCVYVDLLSAKARTLKGLIRQIQSELQTIRVATTLRGFEEQLEKIAAKGVKPVLALDEMDHFARSPDEFTQDFCEVLRALGSAGKIALITASKVGLRELHFRGALVSPLYNIMGVKTLGPFDEGEDVEFVTARRNGVNFTNKQIAAILAKGRSHPLRLQVLCSHVQQCSVGAHSGSLKMAIKEAEAEFQELLGSGLAGKRQNI